MNAMKPLGIIFFLFFTLYKGFSQDPSTIQQYNRKGNFYIYWGWNRAWYSKSDIHFSGAKYDFTLKRVIAYDHPTKFSFNSYFNPIKVTIPQVNFRIGYFIHNKYSVSFGFDHMKYVVESDQIVKIIGDITGTETDYDGAYSNADIPIKSNFLKFEHTNGLNYINIDLRRFDEVLNLKIAKINLTEGIGTGILLPRTSTTLFGRNYNDQYHLSGYGFNGVVGVNISFFRFLFLQTEFKSGFINMPSIRISSDKNEKAIQNFFFAQLNFLVGASFTFHHKNTGIQ